MPPANERVAYRLLDTADQCDTAGDELEGLEYLEQQLAADSDAPPNFWTPAAGSGPIQRLCQTKLAIPVGATLLTLILLLHLRRDPTASSGALGTPTSSSLTGGSYETDGNSPLYGTGDVLIGGWSAEPQDKPPVKPYFSYLSSVLEEHNSRANGGPSMGLLADDLHFPHSSDLAPGDTAAAASDSQQATSANGAGLPVAWWKLGARNDDQYVTVTNYVRAIKSFSHSNSVTLATQATTEFMYHALELCKRWDGPISVAVYTPGLELRIALTLIKFMRHCLPDLLSACIRDRITWHLVYNRDHGPPARLLSFPRLHLDRASFPLFADQDLCPKYSGPEPADLIQQFHQDLKLRNNLNNTNYRRQHSLLYPINVPRNVARLAAPTKYLVSSDIELYPSVNLVQAFISYISRHNVSQLYGCDKFDFTLPIFEVDSTVEAPKTKRELAQLFGQGKAVFFHKYVCDWCQKFPHRDEWLHTDVYGRPNYTAPHGELVIFDTTLRNRSMASWEPIFIGTNEEPLFDDRLTWEGRRDKMGQMYEMCLMGYRQLILGNAFLVHAPGIKHIDKTDVQSRAEYMKHNNAIYDATMLRLRKDYANSVNINRC